MYSEEQLLEKWRRLSPEQQQQVEQFVDSLSLNRTPEELGWDADFFASTAGCLRDDPLQRYPQGEYEQREPIE